MKNILKLSLLLIVMVGCKNDKKSKTDIDKASLIQEWFPYSGYAGEVYALYETSKENNLKLLLTEGSDNIDPVKLVLSKEFDFGVASADRILKANEKGADLVVVGVINYKSPTCFLTRANDKIIVPRDFENKKVGVLSGTNTEMIYKMLKKKTKIDNLSINEVEIPFDLSTFILGEYDVRPAFIYDETISLDKQGVKYNVIKPEDFGVNFIGTVYFTTRDIIENNPIKVEKFVKSLKEGWELALQNPETAIKYLKKFNKNIDFDRELLSLKRGVEYFKGENGVVLYSSKASWVNMAENLKSINELKEIEIDKTIDFSFIK